MLNLRTGVDLLEIDRMKGLKPAIRERFMRRVFTPLELEQAKNSDASLAGRFAAKEAVAKALGTGIGPIRWQDIEIQNDASGMPVVKLKGEAERLAAQLNLDIWSISISHSKTHAVAMAVAISHPEGIIGNEISK